MKALAINTGITRPATVTVKSDIAVKVLLFAAILTCINALAFM